MMDSTCRKWPSLLVLSTAERWSMGILFLTALLLVVCGNTLIIAAVLSKRSLRTRSNLLLVNLCFADLTVGCLALPLAALGMLAEVKQRVSCSLDNTVGFVICLSCAASIFLLTLISYERYVKITHFDSYPNMMRPLKMTILVLLCWTAAGGLAYLYISSIPQLYVDVTLISVTVVCFTLMAIFYGRIFSTVATQAMVIESWKMKDVQMSSDSITADEVNLGCDNRISVSKFSLPKAGLSTNTRKPKRKRLIKSNIVIAKTFIIIMAAFLISWLPFMIVLLLRSILPGIKESRRYASFYHWSLFVSLSSSFVNPIIYNVKNRKIRSQVRKICRFSNEVTNNNSVKSDREDD